MTNTSLIITLLVLLLLGYLLGFAKALRLSTKGIFGLAIAVVACVMLGGTVQTIGFVARFIDSVNQSAGEFLSFLSYFAGYVVFYVLFFFFVLIIRSIILKIIHSVFQRKSPLANFFNRTLGAVFLTGFAVALVLLFLAMVRTIHETSLAKNIIDGISDTFLLKMYLNNPIRFVS